MSFFGSGIWFGEGGEWDFGWAGWLQGNKSPVIKLGCDCWLGGF